MLKNILKILLKLCLNFMNFKVWLVKNMKSSLLLFNRYPPVLLKKKFSQINSNLFNKSLMTLASVKCLICMYGCLNLTCNLKLSFQKDLNLSLKNGLLNSLVSYQMKNNKDFSMFNKVCVLNLNLKIMYFS